MGLTTNFGGKLISTTARMYERLFKHPSDASSLPTNPTNPYAMYRDEVLKEMVGGGSQIGVSERTARLVPAANACVNILAGTVARMEFQVLPREKGAEPIVDHPVAMLMAQPSPDMGRLTFWESAGAELHTHGDAYIYIERMMGTGRPVRLHLADAQSTTRDKDGWWYDLTLGGDQYMGPRDHVTAHQSDVLHFKGPGFDWRNNTSLSPVRFAARSSLANYIASQRHNEISMAKGVHHASHVESGSEVGGPEALKTFEDWYIKNYTGYLKAGIPPVIPPGFKIVKTGFTSQDIQLIDVMKFTITDIARVWQVPLFLLQHFEKSTGGWTNSNLAEQWTNFVRFSLKTHLERYTDEFNMKLLSPADRWRLKTHIDTDPLVMGDMAQIMELLEIAGAKAAIWSVEECREYTGKPAKVPAGQTLRQPTGAPSQEPGGGGSKSRPSQQ